MFTGIIQAVGRIEDITILDETHPAADPSQTGVRLKIDANDLDLSDCKLGDSIAISGACMTVVQLSPPYFWVDVSQESLSKTTGLNQPSRINLEKAMRLQDYVGGHLVTGHVDDIGEVRQFEPVGESYELIIAVPAHLRKFMAPKGSVAINGASLTINTVSDNAQGCTISINLIPHTLQNTHFLDLKIGARVNIEVDLIARYIDRQISIFQTPPLP